MSDEKSLKRVASVVYALQVAGFFTGIAWIVAVVIDYVKVDDTRGTWLESHYRWQIRTFWFGLLWAASAGAVAYLGLFLGGLLGYLSGSADAAGWGAAGGFILFAALGLVIALVDAIWIIYRIVKGWLTLAEGKPLRAGT